MDTGKLLTGTEISIQGKRRARKQKQAWQRRKRAVENVYAGNYCYYYYCLNIIKGTHTKILIKLLSMWEEKLKMDNMYSDIVLEKVQQLKKQNRCLVMKRSPES